MSIMKVIGQNGNGTGKEEQKRARNKWRRASVSDELSVGALPKTEKNTCVMYSNVKFTSNYN